MSSLFFFAPPVLTIKIQLLSSTAFCRELTLPSFILSFLRLITIPPPVRSPLPPKSSSFAMPSMEEQAVALKNEGNKAFAAHDWNKAVELYSKAIELNDKEPTFLTNRAQVRLISLRCSSRSHMPDIEAANIAYIAVLYTSYTSFPARVTARRPTNWLISTSSGPH